MLVVGRTGEGTSLEVVLGLFVIEYLELKKSIVFVEILPVPVLSFGTLAVFHS